MHILPDFLSEIVKEHGEILAEHYSNELYETLLRQNRRHLLVKLTKKLDFRPLEKACKNYHHQSGPGKPPTHTVPRLLRAILIGQLHDLSLRELETELQTNLLARWFAGYHVFEAIPDHSTLGRFEGWLIVYQPRIYFETILKQVKQDFPDAKTETQIGDTYAMEADAATQGVVEMLRQLSIRLLESWREPKADFNLLSGFDWAALFGIFPEKHPGRMSNKEKAQRLQKTVLAAQDLHKRLARKAKPQTQLWLDYIHKVIQDYIEIKAEEIALREKRGTYALASATDPEATFRNHGERDGEEDITFGYNIQVAASEDGIITETIAYTGAKPDQSGVADLVAEQEEPPGKLIYDAAAGRGKTRHDVQEASGGKTKLSAPLIEYEKRSKLFSPKDFSLSEDGRTLTCPTHRQTSVAYRSGTGQGRNFRFYPRLCWQGEPPTRMKNADLSKRCPLWEKCRNPKMGPRSMRQVFISDYRALLEEAEIYNHSESYKQDKRLRQRIERIIAELVRYNRARRARRRGLAAADWQALMSAAAYNLKWWMRRVPAMA
jgi:hypothetical protein